MAIEYRLFHEKSKRYLSTAVKFNNPSASVEIIYYLGKDESTAVMFWEKQWAEKFLNEHYSHVNPRVNQKDLTIVMYNNPSYDWD